MAVAKKKRKEFVSDDKKYISGHPKALERAQHAIDASLRGLQPYLSEQKDGAQFVKQFGLKATPIDVLETLLTLQFALLKADREWQKDHTDEGSIKADEQANEPLSEDDRALLRQWLLNECGKGVLA